MHLTNLVSSAEEVLKRSTMHTSLSAICWHCTYSRMPNLSMQISLISRPIMQQNQEQLHPEFHDSLSHERSLLWPKIILAYYNSAVDGQFLLNAVMIKMTSVTLPFIQAWDWHRYRVQTVAEFYLRLRISRNLDPCACKSANDGGQWQHATVYYSKHTGPPRYYRCVSRSVFSCISGQMQKHHTFILVVGSGRYGIRAVRLNSAPATPVVNSGVIGYLDGRSIH